MSKILLMGSHADFEVAGEKWAGRIRYLTEKKPSHVQMKMDVRSRKEFKASKRLI